MPEGDGFHAPPILQFVDVHKRYSADHVALESLELEVQAGEFFTFLGPSGAGKTTALMMIAGFETPTSGQILHHGQAINDIPPYQRGFGVVFQNRALFPHLSALDNVGYPLKMRGLEKSEVVRLAREALERVQLGGAGSSRPRDLSGGEQQRVALARALVFRPELVLMDEPLASLDEALGDEIQAHIAELHREVANTVVYVTQDQSKAIAISDRIAVLDNGRIAQIDSPTKLYEAPKTSFVAHFIGENNGFDGTVTTTDNGTCQVTLDTGESLSACTPNTFEAGSRTTVWVRPERVSINPSEVDGPNRFKATIGELGFRGDHYRLSAKLRGGASMTVNIPAQADKPHLTPGDEVELGWPVDHCRALDQFEWAAVRPPTGR